MDQPQTGQEIGVGANPVDTKGLCLLSLDGGGVRGLSTLHVLKVIMDQLNHERSKSGLEPVKPCDIFDLIGGTSTGGLIAIMLGRLEMDVDACIAAYSELSSGVFAKLQRRYPVDLRGRMAPKFDSAKLRDAILEIITSQGLSPEALFDDGQDRGCKTFVCAASKDLYGIDRLRSYSYRGKTFLSSTICDAALATSAASGFFDPVLIGARRFVDGALGANNPVEQVEGEASDIWCYESGDLKPLVKCFLSIGTGNPGKMPIEDRVDKFISEALVGIATETEKTAGLFIKRWRQHYDDRRFFRFNVEQGLQNVGLAEHDKQGVIETATEQYMADTVQESRVRECVQNLEKKQDRPGVDFVHLLEEYRTLAVVRQHGSPPRHSIPFLKNRRFLGRTDVLHLVKENLFGDYGPPRVAIVGLGGVGKTQVALQTAYWTKENQEDWSVFWLPALSMAAFEQSCAELAEKLNIRGAEEGAKDSVLRYLCSEQSSRWLLIVDNADDMDTLFGSEGSIGIHHYLPENNDNGRILFTTRSTDVAMAVADDAVIELKKMSTEEAHGFWEEIGPGSSADNATVAELLHELTYLPLAIYQAAAYLKRNRVPISKYLSLLRATQDDIVGLMSHEFRDPTRYEESRHAVATTWLVSFEQILKTDRAAADILSFLSQIEPRAVPQFILPKPETEEALIHAIGTLSGYAFLERRGGEDVYDMHRLVHLAAGVWVRKEKGAEDSRQAAIAQLAGVFPTDEWENREQWRLCMPHALRALRSNGKYTEWDENGCGLGFWAGRCLQEDGRIREAVELLEHVVAVAAQTLSESHSSRLASQHALAGAYQDNGQVEEAVKLLEHVVEVRSQTLSKSHPSRLASQHELAGVYQANGQIKEAIKLLEHVVAVKAQTLSESHPSRLASQHALAGVYQDNGQIKEAVKLLEHVVEVQSQTLSESHPSRLASQHMLAGAYQANGQVEEAVKLLEHVVEVQSQTLSESHPSRLTSQHMLAGAYQANGQVEEAVKLLEHVVEVRSQTLSKSHPSWLVSQYGLAGAYQANGQVKEAVELLEHVVAVEAQTLSESHPSRLASQHELAGAYQDNGQVKEAIKLLEHVVEVQSQTLSESHPSRLASQHELAGAYQANGQVKEAIELLEHVVAVKAQTLSESHPDRLASQHELAGAYRANDQVMEAIKLLEHVVAVEAQTLSESHPSRLTSQHTLAVAYQANGQVKEAIELLEHVVAVEAQTLSESHPSRLASQHELAGAYQANGQVKEAIELLEHVVAVKAQTLSESHPDRLASQHELARAYRANGQVKEAIELLEHVVAVKAQTLSESHPDRLASQHELAGAYRANDQVMEAIKLLEHVVAVEAQTLSESHPSRLASQHELAGAYQANGQVKEAIELLEHVVAVKAQTLSESHPSRLTSQHELARAYRANGQVREAVDLLR